MDGREAFLVVESTKAVLYDSPPTRCPECVLQKSQSMFPDLPSRQNPLMTTPGSKLHSGQIQLTMEGGGELAFSVHDLYPSNVNPAGPITTFVLEGTKLKVPEFRHMSYTNRTRTSMEDGEFNINPEPVPYQPQNFMQTPLPRIGPESSTLLKKVPIPKRHLDSFGGYEYSLGSKRGVILHTDRYQWDAPKSFEGMSQRDRLRAELEYMERLRGIKRRREMLPHRAQLDLLMGGKKVEFSERFDIQREIQKLKSLIMPQNARDLFHGKGFHLPDEHSSLRPRRAPMLDYDSDEDTSVPSSHRLGKQAVDPDTGLPRSRLRQNIGQLPRIVNKNIIGSSESPLLLAREKRTVDQIKARISIPAELQRGRRPISIKNHDMAQETPRFSEDGPWTRDQFARQGTLISFFPRL
uniref:Uncharacterized protein n=1 Tax=Magallana gigas TaxID=29159 RepID=A0A8W8JKT3_MAGGI